MEIIYRTKNYQCAIKNFIYEGTQQKKKRGHILPHFLHKNEKRTRTKIAINFLHLENSMKKVVKKFYF